MHKPNLSNFYGSCSTKKKKKKNYGSSLKKKNLDGSCHKNQENESDIWVHTKFVNICKVDFFLGNL